MDKFFFGFVLAGIRASGSLFCTRLLQTKNKFVV